MTRPSTRRSFLQRVAAVPAVLGAGSALADVLPEQDDPGGDAYWEMVRRQFAFREDKVPMNAANLCPSPRVVAEAVTRSAKARKESRGGQVRLNHPRRDNRNWLKNVIVRMDDGRISVGTENVEMSKFGPNTKGGPNPLRDRIQFIILSLLPKTTQAKILDARLNLGGDS